MGIYELVTVIVTIMLIQLTILLVIYYTYINLCIFISKTKKKRMIYMKKSKEQIKVINEKLPLQLREQYNNVLNRAYILGFTMMVSLTVVLLIMSTWFRSELVYVNGILPVLFILSLVAIILSIKELNKEHLKFAKLYIQLNGVSDDEK